MSLAECLWPRAKKLTRTGTRKPASQRRAWPRNISREKSPAAFTTDWLRRCPRCARLFSEKSRRSASSERGFSTRSSDGADVGSACEIRADALPPRHRGKRSIVAHQFRESSLLNDPALRKDDDRVGRTQRGEAMRSSSFRKAG